MASGAARFIGLDLAWKDANPSGTAVLDADGTLLEASAHVRDDDAIVAWVRAWLGSGPALIGIDMPTIVRNPAGRRAAERDLHAAFGRYEAGPYPANTGLDAFRDEGGRAANIVRRLAADGVREALPVVPGDPRRLAIEVFPHAAMIGVFGLAKTLKYKKKAGRSWDDVLAAWRRYRDLLGALAAADPPLRIPAGALPDAERLRYKQYDDLLDGIMCAYVASYVWRWGTAGPETTVYGSIAEGYIVVPTPGGPPPPQTVRLRRGSERLDSP